MEPLYVLAKGALKPLLARGLRWTIDGAHMIPRHGPAIIASNHIGYLDPLCAAYLVDSRGRRPRFLAKDELFAKRGLGWALRQVKQIPVARGTGDARQALSAAVDALRNGEAVVVFPEGTISLDLDPMPGKTGTARLAALTGVPVVPFGMWGAHRILFKGRDPDWRWGVAHVAVVGPPLGIGRDEDIYDATDRIMEAICAQVRRARELYPDEPEPGDDDWWVRAPETAVLRSCSDGRREDARITGGEDDDRAESGDDTASEVAS